MLHQPAASFTSPPAPASKAPAHPTFRSREVGDRDLIKDCKRARVLCEKERRAEKKLWGVIDRNFANRLSEQESEGPTRAAHQLTLSALLLAITNIAEVEAKTLEGLAYKAALLAPCVTAGLITWDENGPCQDLALSIAQDARIIGMRDVAYRRRRAAKG